MKIIKNILPIAVFTSTLAGCAAFSPGELAKPSNLEIDVVLEKIGSGFTKMKNQLGENKLGIWPCKITTTLNVTASADQGGKLVLDTKIRPPVEPVSADITLHADQTNSSSASRGNVINIEMYNPGCFPKDTVAYQLASGNSASNQTPKDPNPAAPAAGKDLAKASVPADSGKTPPTEKPGGNKQSPTVDEIKRLIGEGPSPLILVLDPKQKQQLDQMLHEH